ncbi:hypothetical protein BN8_03247 [Fibrisoma limi BUZ 3]|uniref:Uncharacterized protein n=1 Tax=Fibrisoma limi BUZ 3 TaxID=1185876 RepID=I2GJM8_9BACT|nr:hypothetical protein [Fibrisoma limi]CCH54103.1 hypothetical protein BN8_03247 [Fibrisoma limi BUZ 3]
MQPPHKTLLKQPATGLILLVPVFIFFASFFYYSLNIPWFDDFESIPYFLTRFLNAASWHEKWEAILRPNNEHRLLYARLVVLLYTTLTGSINFLHLMVIGNLGLIVISGLFYVAGRRQRLAWYYLLPVTLILFQPQPYLMTFTALFSLQYLAIIMLIMLTLYALAQNSPTSYGIALIMGVFSTFSMGNGLLVWVAGAMVLVGQKQWLRLGGWIGVASLAVFGYFYGYPVQQGNQEGFAFLIQHPLQVVRGFFVYAGSLFDLMPAWAVDERALLPLVVGAILIMFWIVWAVRLVVLRTEPMSPWNGFLLGVTLFLVMNTALVALFRTRFNFEMMLWSSYRAYIMVLSAAVYLIFINQLSPERRRRWFPALLGLALVVNVVSYVTYTQQVINWQNSKLALAFNQRYNRIGLGGSRQSMLADFIDQQLDEMKRRGWYELPNPVITANEQQFLTNNPQGPQPLRLTIQSLPDYVTVTSAGQEQYAPGRNSCIYLAMKSDRKTYLIAAIPNPPTRLTIFRPAPGFWAAMPVSMIEPGRYRVGIVRTNSHEADVRYTDQFVDVH